MLKAQKPMDVTLQVVAHVKLSLVRGEDDGEPSATELAVKTTSQQGVG